MMLPRVDHWERLLAAAIDTARAKPFVWGVHDCPTFAFETRMILTVGEDVAALWRRLGWASLEDMGRALLGEPRTSVLLAQRGDIVLADTGLGFGICTGATAVGMAPEGLMTVPLTSCQLAWPI
jgi:hypothetical protein